jgi:hypothetical protein
MIVENVKIVKVNFKSGGTGNDYGGWSTKLIPRETE